MKKRSGIRTNNNKERSPRGQRYIVKSTNTLLPYLFEIFSSQSKTTVKGLLRRGQVQVNGVTTTHFGTALHSGDEIMITYGKMRPVFSHPQLHIVWEDEDLIVIDKAEGLLSMSTSLSQERTAFFILSQYVKSIDPRNKVYLLHRLDKGTSGLMMFAKNKGIQEKMRNNWKDYITERTYIAITEGKLEKTEDTITTYLKEDKMMKVYVTEPGKGKEAITHYKQIKSNDTYSLLEFNLDTGRKNQIRVQMEYLKHPIAGDLKYGAQTDPFNRLMLHAKRLFFVHPVTGEQMRFETPMPIIFEDLVK